MVYQYQGGIQVIISSCGTALPIPEYDSLLEEEMHELKYLFPNIIQNSIRCGLEVCNTKFDSFVEIYP